MKHQNKIKFRLGKSHPIMNNAYFPEEDEMKHKNKTNIIWKIQFIIGLTLISQYWLVSRILKDIDLLFDRGIIVGYAVMCLLWGIREIMGALDKRTQNE